MNLKVLSFIISFFIVIVLSIVDIPIKFTGIEGAYYCVNALPDLLDFAVILIFLFMIIIGVYFFVLRRELTGKIILKRRDKVILPAFLVIFFGGILYPLATNNGILFEKYLVFLAIFHLGILLVEKILTFSINPSYLSFDNTFIYQKLFFRVKKLKIGDIKNVDYSSNKKTIKIHFLDGIDTICIFLKEHHEAELMIFIQELATSTNENIIIDKELRDKYL